VIAAQAVRLEDLEGDFVVVLRRHSSTL
jgi:hypothetical protein